jgi:hypothetical protein
MKDPTMQCNAKQSKASTSTLYSSGWMMYGKENTFPSKKRTIYDHLSSILHGELVVGAGSLWLSRSYLGLAQIVYSVIFGV